MTPYYDLEKIITAASEGNIIYGGRKVSKDITNLGYTFDDVIACITKLTHSHHQKIWLSDDKLSVFDVYVIKHSSHTNKTDSIYIKLRLLENNKIHVFLGSFHL